MSRSAAPDTDELLRLVALGDSNARSQLFDRHRDRLQRMVAVRLDHRLAARIDASDVVQEALAEASQKLTDYVRERPVAFYPWLRRLAWENLVRLSEHHLKAQRRTVMREERLNSALPDQSAALLAGTLAASGLSPDRRLIAAELKSRVMSALAELANHDREILVLRYLEQLSNSEIADVLGLSDVAVRSRHMRALDRLTRLIDREGL